jgi:hypothetical protein
MAPSKGRWVMKNPNDAALGRLARGHKKKYSAAELARRTARIKAAGAKRWPKTTKQKL